MEWWQAAVTLFSGLILAIAGWGLKTLSDIRASIARLEQGAVGIEKDISGIKMLHDKQDERLNAGARRMNYLEGAVKVLQHRFDELKERVNGLS